MPDLDQIKQGEQGVRDRRGRFARGRSGNPAGRPRGCRDHINRAARLLLAGEGEALTRKAVELALAGDPTALRLCLERIVGPYRERAVEFTMPPIGSAADLAGAMAAITGATARGAVTPREANPDTAELQREDANGIPLANADDSARPDDFESKILVMARRFAGGQMPDFANSSFAELFAWSLARPEAGLPGPSDEDPRKEL